jgi:hypothetical protein
LQSIATVSRFNGGRLSEIFLTKHEAGSDADSVASPKGTRKAERASPFFD